MKSIDHVKLFLIVHVMNMKNFYENILILMKFIVNLSINEKKINVKIKSIHINYLGFFFSSINTAESKTIRSELERLHNENIELTKQRETLNITHDIQIKKLHDSYAIKLREAEQWPDRLQSELNREREQHRIQMNELERRLKESFLTVCIFSHSFK